MVQRSLSAKSLSHAKGGSVVAGYLKVLPFYLFVIPGLAARVLYTGTARHTSPSSAFICQPLLLNKYFITCTENVINVLDTSSIECISAVSLILVNNYQSTCKHSVIREKKGIIH